MYSITDEFKYTEMISPSVKNYIENRLIAQIIWYDGKSGYNQKMYRHMIIITTILSSLIPVVTMFADWKFGIVFKIIIVLLSSTVTALTGLMSIFNFKELWTQYRHNCEMLKSILHRYYTETGEFMFVAEDERFKRLVESCEKYFTAEFDKWHAMSVKNIGQTTKEVEG